MPSFLPSLVAVLSWGAMFPIADSALRRVDPANLTAVRYGFAAVILLGLLIAVEGRRALRFDGRFGRVFVLGTAGFAGFNLLSFAALEHTSAEHAALVVATMPMLTLLARWRMVGERPSQVQLACVVAAFLGVGLVITKGDPAALLDGGVGIGELFVLVGAACWVRYTLGAAELPAWSPLRYTALSAAAGTLSILAIAVVGDAVGVFAAPTGGDVGAVAPQIVYVIALGAVAGVLGWNAGVRRLGPANAALFMNLVPITAFAIAAAQGTQPAAVELAGAGLTLAALVAANLAGRGVLRVPARVAAALSPSAS